MAEDLIVANPHIPDGKGIVFRLWEQERYHDYLSGYRGEHDGDWQWGPDHSTDCPAPPDGARVLPAVSLNGAQVTLGVARIVEPMAGG